MKLDAREQKIESSAGNAITYSLVSLDDLKEASSMKSTKPKQTSEIISFDDRNDPYKDTKHSAVTEYFLKHHEAATEEARTGHSKFEKYCTRVEHGRVVFVKENEPLEETKTAKEFELALKLRRYEVQCPAPRVFD